MSSVPDSNRFILSTNQVHRQQCLLSLSQNDRIRTYIVLLPKQVPEPLGYILLCGKGRIRTFGPFKQVGTLAVCWFNPLTHFTICGSEGNRTPKPFTAACFQDKFLVHSDHFQLHTLQESNLWPTVLETVALPIELKMRINKKPQIFYNSGLTLKIYFIIFNLIPEH